MAMEEEEEMLGGIRNRGRSSRSGKKEVRKPWSAPSMVSLRAERERIMASNTCWEGCRNRKD
jgi:hypothetical protein